ncbi:MAG: domain S-box protein [Frankiales bacterium]|nr:domain S-box protein [Frankiales bacterium]
MSRLHRLVLLVAGVGLVAQLLAGLVVAGEGAIAPLDVPGLHPLHGWPLVAGLLVATFLSDFMGVRVRHGDEPVEELTLFEVAVVVVVLVLPGLPALLLPVAATTLCSVVRRRGLVKTAFNAGNLAAATAVLVTTVHVVATPDDGLSPRTVAGVTAGMLAFTVLNLVAVSRVLAVVTDDHPWQVVRDGLRLSVVLAFGAMALGSTAVTLAWASPALLPFAFMPAGALLFAYRAAAQEVEERERSTRLLELSQLLAGRREAEDMLTGFLRLARQVFGADVALAVLDTGAQPGGSEPLTVLHDRETGEARRTATAVERRLLERAALEGAGALDADLPEGWIRALVAPLEAEGRRLGAVVLAVRDRSRSLGPRELTLLTPTASALAVALRAAAHLKRVEEETGKLQAVVDQSSDGILVLDGTGVVQLWSPAVERLSGRSSAAALGRPLPVLLATRGADGTACDPFLVGRDLLTPDEPQATVEMTLLREDGEQRVVRCAFAGVFDDDVLQRAVVIVHDVTRERQVERLKADFIATVSHELRTPVTPIKGYADLLRRKGDRMTPEKRDECLDVIVDRAGHLARLVEDLLLASRISATEGASPAQVEMGHDDLAALTRRACADFGTEGDRVTVSVPDGPVGVACDRLRVIQVLTNLVGNALKYSTPGSPVSVRLRVQDGNARVAVTDVGRGIPADQLERVFEKFHRVEDPMRMTTGGTGLGLYIARQLSSAMGGTLSCTSTLGVGSVFAFVLPLSAAPDPGTPLTPAPALPSWPAGRPEGGSGGLADVVPRPRGRNTPPWATPPPRPSGAGPEDPLRLG